MIFDTHVHYDDEAFTIDRDTILSNLKAHNIEAVVNIGSSIQTTKNTLELVKKYPFVYGAVGVHPSETAELTEPLLDWIKSIAVNFKIVAIGEIGLDYYWDEPSRDIQKHWFIKQIALAKEVKLPIVVHSRDAAKDTLDIIKTEHADTVGGVIHCFSYGIEVAREYLDMGFYLGIGGVITFKNAKKLQEVVEYMPIDRIVLETDSPYLSPEPNRGMRNTSFYLSYVVKAIAAIKKISPEEVVAITNSNAKTMYHLNASYGKGV